MIDLKIGDYVRVKSFSRVGFNDDEIYAGKIVRPNSYNSNLWVILQFDHIHFSSWWPDDLQKLSDEEAMIYILENA